MSGLYKKLLNFIIKFNFKYANKSLYVKINCKAGGILLGKKI